MQNYGSAQSGASSHLPWEANPLQHPLLLVIFILPQFMPLLSQLSASNILEKTQLLTSAHPRGMSSQKQCYNIFSFKQV